MTRKWSLPACRISQQQQIKQQSFAFLSLYEENPSVGGFPLQRTGYTESALAWWRHRGTEHYGTLDPFTNCDQLRLGHTVRRNYSAMPNSKDGVIKPQLKLRIVIIYHCFHALSPWLVYLISVIKRGPWCRSYWANIFRSLLLLSFRIHISTTHLFNTTLYTC